MKRKPVISKVFDDNFKFCYNIHRLIDNSVLDYVTLNVRGGVDMSFTNMIYGFSSERLGDA